MASVQAQDNGSPAENSSGAATTGQVVEFFTLHWKKIAAVASIILPILSWAAAVQVKITRLDRDLDCQKLAVLKFQLDQLSQNESIVELKKDEAKTEKKDLSWFEVQLSQYKNERKRLEAQRDVVIKRREACG